MSELYKKIKELSGLCGTSGDEKDIRNYIKNDLISLNDSNIEISEDNIGNLIVFKKGKSRPKNKIMLCAHMDEVGFIVTHIAGDGRLKFEAVGGISPMVVFGRRVIFKNGQTGVIAGKALHHMTDDEKDKQPKISELYIDIGTENEEETKKLIEPGEFCYFDSSYEEFGEGFIKGKALDDRVGCAIMIEMLSKEQEYDMYCVFTVQEEIGTRGALCAAYNVKPDMAIILETTTACDIAGTEEEKQVCRLGEGVVVSFMDRSTIYDRELYHLARDTAGEIGVKHQTKTLIAGGNDSGAVHKAVGGVRTAALSVPTRYLHSPSCVMKKEDVEAAAKTAQAFFEKLAVLERE